MYVFNGSPQAVQAANALDLANRANLTHLRDWWFDGLLICTAVVGIGLLMEAPEIIHDMWGISKRKSIELKYWLTPSIDRRERHAQDWMKRLTAAGWVLIVLGVMGEGLSEGFVHKYDTALSILNDAIVSEAQKESAHAEATAKGFDAQIAKSNAAAKSAEATARGFEAQIAGAQRDASESKKEAEAERLERTKLEAAVAPRSLSLDQQKRIANACRAFQRHGVLIRSYGMDGEAAALGGQIIATLRAANLVVVDGRGSITVSGGFDTGVHIRGPATENWFADTLGQALSVIGDLKVAVNDPEPSMGAIIGGGGQAFTPGSIFLTLTVGVKPLPIIPPAK
jgi:hypothetical protein